MKYPYYTGLVRHLLQQNPDVVKVETLAEAGIEGPAWHPGWLKVTMTNGTSIVLSIARSSPDVENPDQPAEFNPEDLAHVSSVRSPHLSQVG